MNETPKWFCIRGTEHGAAIIRQFMIRLLKAFGYLKKKDQVLL